MGDPFEKGKMIGEQASDERGAKDREISKRVQNAKIETDKILENMALRFSEKFYVKRQPGFFRASISTYDDDPYIQIDTAGETIDGRFYRVGGGYDVSWHCVSDSVQNRLRIERKLTEEKMLEIAGTFFGSWQDKARKPPTPTQSDTTENLKTVDTNSFMPYILGAVLFLIIVLVIF